MDFTIQKPGHMVALAALLFAFFVIVVLPLLLFFGIEIFGTVQTTQITEFSETFRFLFELIAVFLQIFFMVLGLFIGVPLLWYFLVNNLSLKEMFSRLKLRLAGIDMAILWGVLAVILGFAILFAISTMLSLLGFDLSDTSNIPELELYFSLPSMVLILTVQPIGEEIFFRGFLLDKLDSLMGKHLAVIGTAVLFGIAHLSYGLLYPAVMAGILGILFGYIVIKTQNLYSSILAHVLFNIISFSIYILAQSLPPEALIL